METATVSITIPVDHPELQQILSLVRATGASSATANAGFTEGREQVLERLLAAQLNDGEVAFLQLLAQRAPATVPYSELVALYPSAQKLGNVTAGLFRRWRSRGGSEVDAPWADVPSEGRRMSETDAAVVLAALRGRS